MNTEQRQEAIFGAFDGVVSVTGFIFGLLIHHSPESAIAIGGVGGAVAAGISMGAGELEKGDNWVRRIPVGIIMFLASLFGALVAVWPFFVFSTFVSLWIAGTGCLLVATWIGYEKRKGRSGYLAAYLTLIAAAGLTLGIVSLIPQAG